MKMEPCPFCGGEAKIGVCDDEGNIKDACYENAPYGGLGFVILHSLQENEGCPIATHADDVCKIGCYIYDTREYAAAAWNKRARKEMA